MSIESMMSSNHLILCHPLLLLPSIFPSIRVFPNESVLLIRWPKYWSFSISPSNEYSGLTSFRIDLIFLQSKGLSKVLQHQFKNINFQCSAFFVVQPSRMYITTGKTRQTFVGKMMSLLFNMLYRLIIREGNGNPLQYSCLENPMVGYSPWGHKESDMMERLHFSLSLS